MEIRDKVYFENKTNYKPKDLNRVYPESLQEIFYLSAEIRNIARDALNNDANPIQARKDISDFLHKIRQLKMEKI